MYDYNTFLRMILEKRYDDAPRLVLAEWLEDTGNHDRGEFIRVQCELASFIAKYGIHCLCKNNQCRLCYLRLIELDLLTKYGEIWLHPNPLGLGYPVSSFWTQMGWAYTHKSVKLGESYVPVQFKRGFIDSIIINSDIFMNRAKDIFKVHPITKVTLSDCVPYRNCWRCITSLEFNRNPLAYFIPKALFDLTEGYSDNQCKKYNSEKEAKNALSDACVKFGIIEAEAV